MAVAGMPANPDEARQVGLHIADRRAARYARGSDVGGACRGCEFGPQRVPRRRFMIARKRKHGQARVTFPTKSHQFNLEESRPGI